MPYTRAMEDTRSGTCPYCERPTGGLIKHMRACRAKEAAGRALRAAAHADGREPVNGVGDLALARLLEALEGGAPVYPAGSMTQWSAPTLPRWPHGPLSATVNEAIRTGLARIATEHTGAHTVRTHLAAAPVHKRSNRRPHLPACIAGQLSPPLDGPERRWRLIDELIYVDCQACVDVVSR